MANLGSKIRKAREKEGLTQSALGKKLDLSQTTIAQWEAGKDPGDHIENLEAILGPLTSSSLSREPSIAREEISSFGVWLRNARDKVGFSVSELSSKAEVAPPTIYNIESGKIQSPQEETIKRLEKALKTEVPKEIDQQIREENSVPGLGILTDFNPYDPTEWPTCPGVYVLYDVCQRPMYVGKSDVDISSRIKKHTEKGWYMDLVIQYASYIEVRDPKLCHQLEQTLIRFLKSNAVLNRQSAQKFV